MIYLDNAATTALSDRVYKAMKPWLEDEYGNPGSLYPFGAMARNAVEEARARVARMIHAQPEQIIFTSGGTESNRIALLGAADYLAEKGKKNILTSTMEHDSVLRPLQYLESKGFTISRINHELSEAYVLPCLGMVTAMEINNEIGTMTDIEKIGNACHENGVLFHTDCVQSACWYPHIVDKIGCDFLSMSAHKFHGPKGVGALFVRDRNVLSKMFGGGDDQEFGFRGGTENVAGIVGMGVACRLEAELQSDNRLLFVTFENVLNRELGADGYKRNTPVANWKINSYLFRGVDAETLVIMLGAKGVCVSAGSACRSLEQEPSPVLLAVGLTPEEARQSIRVSISDLTTTDQLVTAAEIIAQCVKELRGGE